MHWENCNSPSWWLLATRVSKWAQGPWPSCCSGPLALCKVYRGWQGTKILSEIRQALTLFYQKNECANVAWGRKPLPGLIQESVHSGNKKHGFSRQYIIDKASSGPLGWKSPWILTTTTWKSILETIFPHTFFLHLFSLAISRSPDMVSTCFLVSVH